MKVFLDANILFSLSNAGSVTHSYLLAAAKRCIYVTSSYASEEARRNLQQKRSTWLGTFEHLMEQVEVADKLQPFEALVLPDKDRTILAAAIGAKCNYLLTGDKSHFGPFYGQSVQGVAIVSLKLFAEALDTA